MSTTKPPNFNGDEVCAILEAINNTLDEQIHYLDIGDTHGDYGDEWPEAAANKEQLFISLASVAQKLGASALAEDCEALATRFNAETVAA